MQNYEARISDLSLNFYFYEKSREKLGFEKETETASEIGGKRL